MWASTAVCACRSWAPDSPTFLAKCTEGVSQNFASPSAVGHVHVNACLFAGEEEQPELAVADDGGRHGGDCTDVTHCAARPSVQRAVASFGMSPAFATWFAGVLALTVYLIFAVTLYLLPPAAV